MYYRDCTASWSADFIREILDAADHPRDGLEMVELFITNQYTVEQICEELGL